VEEIFAIGDVAGRAGLSVAAVRYYESRGLISSVRSAGNQRRYPRSVLRRLAFVAAAQRVGLSLEEVAAALATLPEGRTPTRSDWTRLSAGWRRRVDERIEELHRLRDDLHGCIGCGCLSLRRCALYNPGDEARREGAGARWVRDARGAAADPAPSGHRR
jgi:MerR family transcriptional regulator, redox-sensitive transcriptional activator SoxR